MAKVNIKKLDDRAVIPTYGSEFSAGADLYALPGQKIELKPNETTLVHTGIAMEIPEGYAGFVFARSGIATKRGLAPANKVGVIDSDYRGEIMVALHNHSDSEKVVESGERIAQLVIAPFLKGEFEVAEALQKLCEDSVHTYSETLKEGFAVLEHGLGGLLGIVKGIVLLPEIVLDDADSLTELRQHLAERGIVHSKKAGDALCHADGIGVGCVDGGQPLGQQAHIVTHIHCYIVLAQLILDQVQGIFFACGTHQSQQVIPPTIFCYVGKIFLQIFPCFTNIPPKLQIVLNTLQHRVPDSDFD